jgi:hypothetical protein
MYTPAVTIVAAWMRADTGGRAFHGVGQPDVEWDLRALAASPHEQEEADHGDRPELPEGFLGPRAGVAHEVHEVERAEVVERQDHAQDQARIADAVDDERLLARVGRALLREPEADEQVRAEAHALPAHEQERQLPPSTSRSMKNVNRFR